MLVPTPSPLADANCAPQDVLPMPSLGRRRMEKLTIRPVSVIDAVATSLRERILSGDIAPDTPLPEADLAAQYGVARPTIRVVIQQLVLTGLLYREANRSAFVPRLDAYNVSDLFFVRTMVETEAVRLVTARRTRPLEAEQAVRRLEAFGRDVKWSDVVEADLDFHRALVAAATSPRLLRLFALLEDEIRLSISQLKPAYDSAAALAREHRDLLIAIEEGDQKTAVARHRHHLDQAIDDLMRVSKPTLTKKRAAR
jgi:DNA-binding GntR family transcriptional regulator